jgi:hypothetical protein
MQLRPLRVLVACEHSGRVREALAKRGHDAWSCDLLPTDIPGKHIQADVKWVIGAEWDMLIAFPPCTYLARSGARWWKDRQKEQEEALAFVRMLMEANIPKIAIENPIGKINSAIRKPDQTIQPWQFGHGETKATSLWLKNLPKLTPTLIVPGRDPKIAKMPQSKARSTLRSLTYPGVAEAMAEQWAGTVEPVSANHAAKQLVAAPVPVACP